MLMESASGSLSLERVVRAVEKVRERLLRATAALEKVGIPYAVAGAMRWRCGYRRLMRLRSEILRTRMCC